MQCWKHRFNPSGHTMDLHWFTDAHLRCVENLYREELYCTDVPFIAVDFVGLGGLRKVLVLGFAGVGVNDG